MATTVEATTTTQRAKQPVAVSSWLRDPKRQATAGVAAAALIALGVWFVITSGRRKEDFASRVLSQALATADKGNLPQASAELQRVIQTYSGTEAAGEAVLALNQIRMASGQSELAAVNLREFVGKSPPAKLAAQAYGLLGAADENAKRYVDAGKAYEQAAAAAELAYLKASYLIDAGRAYRLGGKSQDAIRAYRTVLEKYPASPSAPEAKIRLGELTAGAM
jgi:outer membrane protein assembly factor BamD (BamD/ComL family)